MSEAVSTGRLRWRCRRGTRELDALLTWFLDARFHSADLDTQRAFAEVLEAEDPEVWDWCMGKALAPEGHMRAVIDAIRDHHRV